MNSSSIYIRYSCITSPEDVTIPLTYEEAYKKYAVFKAVKSNKSTVKATDSIIHPTIGKLYQVELAVNKNFPLLNINKYSERSIYLSGTWNKWLINYFHTTPPYGTLIADEELRTDLYKLSYLVNPILDNDMDIFLQDRLIL